MRGITLIGMPGSGKSTVGKALAERLNLAFLDLDAYIAAREGRSVGDIVRQEGGAALAPIETEAALAVPLERTVLSPGGSIVYSDDAMQRLQGETLVVFLNVAHDELVRRIGDMDARGIVGLATKSLEEIHAERLPLYRKYAAITVDTSLLDVPGTVDAIVKEAPVDFS